MHARPRPYPPPIRRYAAAGVLVVAAACASDRAPDDEVRVATAAPDSCSVWTERRGIIGWESPKIVDGPGGRTLLWAGGGRPGAPGAEWYDFTDSPIPAGDLQYGIGRDRIPAIDDPYFVDPDDLRLLDVPPSPYRVCERPATNDEIFVIGYVVDGEARAYPTALLDRHEIVNDRSRGTGKPFTVGW